MQLAHRCQGDLAVLFLATILLGRRICLELVLIQNMVGWDLLLAEGSDLDQETKYRFYWATWI